MGEPSVLGRRSRHAQDLRWEQAWQEQVGMVEEQEADACGSTMWEASEEEENVSRVASTRGLQIRNWRIAAEGKGELSHNES